MTEDNDKIPFISMELEQPDPGDKDERAADSREKDDVGEGLPPSEDAGRSGTPSDTPRHVAPRGIPGAVSHGSPLDWPEPPPPLPAEAGTGPSVPAFEFTPPPMMAKHPPFAMDVGGLHYLFSRGEGRAVSSYSGEKAFLRVMANFPDAPCGLLELQGSLRFIDVLARKRLEEQGELGPDMSLVTYAPTRGKGHLVNLAYQCIPKHQYESIRSRCESHAHGAVVFDPISLGLGLAELKGKRDPVATAIRSQGSLLLVMAKGGSATMVHRYTLLEGRQEALEDALHTIERELDLHGQVSGDTVDRLHFIDTLVPEEESGLPETSIPVERLPLSLLHVGGRRFASALPSLLASLPLRHATMCREEAGLRPLERFEPLLWAAMACVVLVFGVMSWNRLAAQAELQEDIGTLNTRIESLRNTMPELAGNPELEARPSIDLASDLLMAAYSPTIGEVWNRISRAMPSPIVLSDLVLTTDDPDMTVELAGLIAADLSRSQTAYRSFLQDLESQGFHVAEQHMMLDPAGNTFFLRLDLPGPEVLQSTLRPDPDQEPTDTPNGQDAMEEGEP